MSEKLNTLNHLNDLLNMALADSNIDINELTLIYEMGLEKGITKAEIDELQSNIKATSVEPPKELKDKVKLLFDLCLIIWADGKVVKEEKDLLLKFIVQCKFKKEDAEEIADYLLERTKAKASLEEILDEIKDNSTQPN